MGMNNIDIIKLCAIKYPLKVVQKIEPIIIDCVVGTDFFPEARPFTNFIDATNQVFLGDLDITYYFINVDMTNQSIFIKDFLNLISEYFIQPNDTTSYVSRYANLKNIWASILDFNADSTQFFIHGIGYRITFAP